MNMLTTLNKADVINLIYEQIDLFASFKKIYLFGSILYRNENINDIDILLLYEKFSASILTNINFIEMYIEKKMQYPVDITALSFEEEKEIRFIDKLNKKYICLK